MSKGTCYFFFFLMLLKDNSPRISHVFACSRLSFQGDCRAIALEDGDSAYLGNKRQACLLPIIKDSGYLSSGVLSWSANTECVGIIWPFLHHSFRTGVQETGTEMILWIVLLLWVINCPLSLTRSLCHISAFSNLW